MKLDKFSLVARHRIFNRALPTAIYFHGWTDNGEEFLSPVALRGAYRHVRTHNFITVDWNAFSTKNYISAIKDLQVVSGNFRFISISSDFFEDGRNFCREAVGVFAKRRL